MKNVIIAGGNGFLGKQFADFLVKKKGYNVHIIDLRKTVTLLSDALEFVSNLTKSNGSILFVGTKSQAGDIVKKYANYTYIMYKSNIIENGPTSKIFKNPKEAYTKELFSSSYLK